MMTFFLLKLVELRLLSQANILYINQDVVLHIFDIFQATLTSSQFHRLTYQLW
ncbi:hypothetical protein KGEDBEEJ_01212 [Aeromonas hydrophila]